MKENINPSKNVKGKDYDVLKMILIIIPSIALMAVVIHFLSKGATSTTVSYSQFSEQLSKGNISKVVFNGEQVEGIFDPPLENQTDSGITTRIETFRTYLPPIPDNSLLELLKEKGVTIETRSQNSSPWWTILLTWIPILVIGLLIFQMFRRMPTGQSEGVTSIHQSRSKVYDRNIKE
jgi:cell division protease FtsH